MTVYLIGLWRHQRSMKTNQNPLVFPLDIYPHSSPALQVWDFFVLSLKISFLLKMLDKPEFEVTAFIHLLFRFLWCHRTLHINTSACISLVNQSSQSPNSELVKVKEDYISSLSVNTALQTLLHKAWPPFSKPLHPPKWLFMLQSPHSCPRQQRGGSKGEGTPPSLYL